MKRIFLIFSMLSLFSSIYGQSQYKVSGDSIPWEIRKQSYIYNLATQFSDFYVAKMALYNLISESPTNLKLYDSLSFIYYQYGQYASSALVSQRSLAIKPDNVFALEIAASSFENLGVKDKSVDYYERLYLAGNDMNVLYKIAFLQYELARYNESKASISVIKRVEDNEDFGVYFPSQDKKGQRVSLKIAALRIEAMIEESMGNELLAKQKYLDILKMSPGLEIIQKQLYDLNKKDKKE